MCIERTQESISTKETRNVMEITFSSKGKKSKERYALIDGMNVAMIRQKQKKGKLENIIRVYDILKETYDYVEIFVDASIRYRIDDQNELDRLIKEETIFLCPAGITADELIWKRSVSLCSEEYNVTIVTNDMFPVKLYNSSYHTLRNITVSILPTDDIYLIDRDLKRFEKGSRRSQLDSSVKASGSAVQ